MRYIKCIEYFFSLNEINQSNFTDDHIRLTSYQQYGCNILSFSKFVLQTLGYGILTQYSVFRGGVEGIRPLPLFLASKMFLYLKF